MKKIEIRIENVNQKLYINQGSTLIDILQILFDSNISSKYVAAYVDNKLRDLTAQIFESKSIRFVELNSTEGYRIYARTAIFLLQKAVYDILGNTTEFIVTHPVGQGYYIELKNCSETITKSVIDKLLERMHELVSADIAIIKEKIELSDAIELFNNQGRNDKALLCETRPHYWLSIYNLAGIYGYFYGAMLHTTAMLKVFDLKSYGNGVVLLLPSKDNPSEVEEFSNNEKLYSVFKRHQHWIDIIGIPNIGELNKRVLAGEGGEIIKLAEALQEKEFSDLADIIYKRHKDNNLRVIFVSGPSSSGKTTFAKRLSVQLSVLGLKPHRISLDDYFVDRDRTPLDENGEYDFEALETVDLEYFNSDFSKLLAGESIELPRFDFKQGIKVASGKVLELTDCSVVIVEGIHALNPKVSESIARSDKFFIYASALTALSIDNTSVVHTTDNRLLRRIVRDNQYRARDAKVTIEQWMSVRRGEERYIFPYQEQADYMFNTALLYEFSILKSHVVPLLLQVPANCTAYAEAKRLRQFLSYFSDMGCEELPGNSLLREFIGGSNFKY